jgi:chloride channel protein, CIC family
LVGRFEPRMAIAALGASATAIAVGRVITGDVPDFAVAALAYPTVAAGPLFVVLGIIAGVVAVAYNYGLLGALAAADRLKALPVEVRAGLVGAAVGVLAWFMPDIVGGGDPLTQRALSGADALAVLPLLFLTRFGLGAVSYAAGTPGGLFAPMLVLGAQLGIFFGVVCQIAFPALGIQPAGFGVVGMAAFFTGVVRAPITGIALVTEMTASFTMLLPMLGACFAAMLVPMLLRNRPIYDSLREHTLRREREIAGPTGAATTAVTRGS